MLWVLISLSVCLLIPFSGTLDSLSHHAGMFICPRPLSKAFSLLSALTGMPDTTMSHKVSTRDSHSDLEIRKQGAHLKSLCCSCFSQAILPSVPSNVPFTGLQHLTVPHFPQAQFPTLCLAQGLPVSLTMTTPLDIFTAQVSGISPCLTLARLL